MPASAIFEPNPALPGHPRLCIAAKRPAFESRAAIDDYVAKYLPGAVFDAPPWQCEACRLWHFAAHFVGPSGGSSGLCTRHETLRIPAEICASIRRSAPKHLAASLRAMKPRGEKGDLL